MNNETQRRFDEKFMDRTITALEICGLSFRITADPAKRIWFSAATSEERQGYRTEIVVTHRGWDGGYIAEFWRRMPGSHTKLGARFPTEIGGAECVINMAKAQMAALLPVIIESPYAGDVEANLAYLDRCILDCLARGQTPYASHKMLTTALDDNDPDQRKQGIDAGLAMRRHFPLRAFYVDRGWSRGMEAAKVLYDEEGLPYEIRNLEP